MTRRPADRPDDRLWALAHAERAALAEDLAHLTPEQYLDELDGPGVPTLRERVTGG
ncbi:hypothetical protein [Cellulomonas xiejunii]|uniref:hypothetical protein n=1 Tax=Cellulomonas xiejunii TaxID=2968083 RepID=UPI001D0F2854|nr:hypothetical protein [Cellulomonas xiejunii]MCC2314359.1 hypothetical protein [Cellulomonas xiejunii]